MRLQALPRWLHKLRSPALALEVLDLLCLEFRVGRAADHTLYLLFRIGCVIFFARVGLNLSFSFGFYFGAEGDGSLCTRLLKHQISGGSISESFRAGFELLLGLSVLI